MILYFSKLIRSTYILTHHTEFEKDDTNKLRYSTTYELISCSEISGPPTMLNTMPFAFEIGKSKSGDDIADIAASMARVFPFPCPMPISAVPTRQNHIICMYILLHYAIQIKCQQGKHGKNQSVFYRGEISKPFIHSLEHSVIS